MRERETCYGCDYDPKELTEIVEAHLPDGIKLCLECMEKGESND